MGFSGPGAHLEPVVGSGSGDVDIIGGGLAAVRTAQALRDKEYGGRLRIFSDEAEPPYDRPPLSKDFLQPTAGIGAPQLLEEADYERLGIELHLGHRACALDLAERTVSFADRTPARYDRLVIATGAEPRRLPGLPSGGAVHYLRSVADARRLCTALVAGAAVAIVGGGFIGLEVAAAAIGRGCSVTVVEAGPQPLSGALGVDAAAWLQGHHEQQGVRFVCGRTVRGHTMAGGRAVLELDDGTALDADVVAVGVGIERDLDWLAGAGLAVHRGVEVDDAGRTSAPGVFAAGDVSCRHDRDGCHPVEHWTAATESAARAAGGILDSGEPPRPDEAYFWSHQGGVRIQSVGRPTALTRGTVVDGALDGAGFVIEHRAGERLLGVVAVNAPRAFLRSRLALLKELQPSVQQGAST